MKTHVLLLAKNFPANHPKAGTPTQFFTKIIREEKKHTIRANYDLWKRRIDNINAGKAILSIREWTAQPYRSPQRELCVMKRVGLQKLEMTPLGWFVDDYDSDFTTQDFAAHDGLSFLDFSDWFRGKISIDMEPMAIIHFTDFRYGPR